MSQSLGASDHRAQDVALVLAAQQGDRNAWRQLCLRHAPRLAAYIGGRLRRPALVEKLVMDVVVGAWKHLGELERPEDFPAWFRRVGGNLTLQWCRHHAQESLAESFPVERCGGDANLARRMENLDAALFTLGDSHRLALEHCVRGGMDAKDMGEALHLDEAGVERLLEEALNELERRLSLPST